MNLQALALAFLAATAIGGLAWVFIYPLLSGEKKAELRRASVAKSEPAAARQADKTQRSRRERVEGSLKELESRRSEKKVPLSSRLTQAGLDWSPRKFMILSGVLAAACFAITMLAGGGLIGGRRPVPRRWLGSATLELELPQETPGKEISQGAAGRRRRDCARHQGGACRCLKSIKVVATDAPEPLKSEFHAIIETQAIGMPLGDACARLFERMPVQEANFFGIVIAIQQKSGGNLSEALGNLSKVLRDRKKMAEKIQAMSMEAKASAGIIGALPPLVMLLVYLSSPAYISLLWTHPIGQLMLVGSAIWMSMGIFVMKKMINFDF